MKLLNELGNDPDQSVRDLSTKEQLAAHEKYGRKRQETAAGRGRQGFAEHSHFSRKALDA
jgi:hypothetical protein